MSVQAMREVSVRARAIAIVGALLLASLVWWLPAHSAEPDWPNAITIATASPGGTYHAYGEGLAESSPVPSGSRGEMRPTEGPAEEHQAARGRRGPGRFRDHGRGPAGWGGTGDWTGGRQHRAMRALFPMYDRRSTSLSSRHPGSGRSPTWPESASVWARKAGPRLPTRRLS